MMVCSPGHGCWCLPVLHYHFPPLVFCFHLVSRKQRARPPLAVYVQCLSGGTRAALCKPFNIPLFVRVMVHTIPVDNLAHRNDSCTYRNILQVVNAWSDHSIWRHRASSVGRHNILVLSTHSMHNLNPAYLPRVGEVEGEGRSPARIAVIADFRGFDLGAIERKNWKFRSLAGLTLLGPLLHASLKC